MAAGQLTKCVKIGQMGHGATVAWGCRCEQGAAGEWYTGWLGSAIRILFNTETRRHGGAANAKESQGKLKAATDGGACPGSSRGRKARTLAGGASDFVSKSREKRLGDALIPLCPERRGRYHLAGNWLGALRCAVAPYMDAPFDGWECMR
jgi:hypothetical protein